VEKTLSNTQTVTLRDGNAAYVARHFAFAKLPTYITGVKLSLNVTTTYRGDLDVYLRSPSGRVRWVAEHNASDSATNLRITQADLTDSYTGSNPNGRWSLFLRDFYRGDIARYVNSSVTISSR